MPPRQASFASTRQVCDRVSRIAYTARMTTLSWSLRHRGLGSVGQILRYLGSYMTKWIQGAQGVSTAWVQHDLGRPSLP